MCPTRAVVCPPHEFNCLQLPQMYVSICSAYSFVSPTHIKWNHSWQWSHCTQLIWSPEGSRHCGAEHSPSSSSSNTCSLHPRDSFELPLFFLRECGREDGRGWGVVLLVDTERGGGVTDFESFFGGLFLFLGGSFESSAAVGEGEGRLRLFRFSSSSRDSVYGKKIKKIKCYQAKLIVV